MIRSDHVWSFGTRRVGLRNYHREVRVALGRTREHTHTHKHTVGTGGRGPLASGQEVTREAHALEKRKKERGQRKYFCS